MSTVFLHVGQCGNQLGHTFWQEVDEWYSSPNPGVVSSIPIGRHKPSSKISNKFSATASSGCTARTCSHPHTPYSLLDGTLPCVLVDTETKVIRKCTGEKTLLGKRIPGEFRVVERGGRGNNWAYGFFSAKENRAERGGKVKMFTLTEPETLVNKVQECVRRLAEKCDRLGGFVQLHSIAGGTGSGVGSAIIEQLRQDYPLSYILSAAVVPFSQGETPLQHYNSLFCLQQLHTHTDGAILFHNDHTLAQVLKLNTSVSSAMGRSGSDRTMADVTVEDMNRHISNTLCNVLLPVWSDHHKAPVLSSAEPWELIRSACPDTGMKFLSPFHCQLNRPTCSWDNAFSGVTSAYRNTISSTTTETDPAVVSTQRPLTSALVSVCRGSPTAMSSLASNTTSIEKRLKQTYNTVPWNPFPIDFWWSLEPHLRDKKVVSILANSAAIGGYLKHTLERARLMHHERAYLHWFQRYGCDQGMFEEAFETVETVIKNYSSLS